MEETRPPQLVVPKEEPKSPEPEGVSSTSGTLSPEGGKKLTMAARVQKMHERRAAKKRLREERSQRLRDYWRKRRESAANDTSATVEDLETKTIDSQTKST